MADYECYFIGDMRHGVEEGLEPWLLPKDAWSEINNGFLRRGVLNKRNGYTEFARMIHAVDDESIGALGSKNYSGTLSNIPIREGDLSFTDGTQDIDDDGDGTLSGDGSGTINYTTGAYDITFTNTTTGAVTADYDYYPGNSIVGIELYSNLATSESDLMIFDKKRCAKWDTTNEKLEDVTSADTWTGGDYDYFWGCNARNILYITNNVDQVYYWNGSAWTALTMDINGNGSNDVDTCLSIIFYKERLIVLRPTESSTLHPQRARWCSATDHNDWSNDGYVDAPTNDWIMTADFLGEDLIVWFENSTWRLKYTGDSDLPFRWEQIDTSQGCYAEYSGFNYYDVMGVVGATNIMETDNLRVYQIDDKIPDAVINMDQSHFSKIYTLPIAELQQVIMSYTPVGGTENTESLCFNYDDKAWSRYDYGFNVYGYYKEGETGYTLDDLDETWDELEISWDDSTRQAGYPTTLGGDSSGYIWKINYGGTDNDEDIEFTARSGRWNPHLKENSKTRFGWIEFLVDRDPDINMTVDFYAHIDGQEELVESQTLTFGEGVENADKIWIRADNGAIGDFHRILLTNDESNQTVAIHAMKIFMKRAN